MLTVYTVVVALFTAAGPGVFNHPVKDLDECKSVEKDVPQIFTGTKVPGPNGEDVLVLDAQGKCLVFTQGTQARN